VGSVGAPARVSFPRGVWVALAVFATLLIGGIITQVALIRSQLETNEDQRNIVRTQLRQARPVLESSRPLTREQLRDLPVARRRARELSRLAREAIPLAAELRDAGAGDSVRAGRELAASLLQNDAGGTFAGFGHVVGELLYRYRLRRLLVSSLRATEIIPRQYETQAETLRIQRQTLAIQRQTVALAEQTLAVARDTERHAESLDRKLLGPPR
jgi:hypothetical protein